MKRSTTKLSVVLAAVLIIIHVYLPHLIGRIDNEALFVIRQWQKQQPKPKDSLLFKGESSEQKILFLGLFQLYNTIISSQDKNSCTFTVSCSRFSLQAIKRCGVLHGLMITSDRLQRCHSMNKGYYSLDLKIKKNIDYPVIEYCISYKYRESK